MSDTRDLERAVRLALDWQFDGEWERLSAEDQALIVRDCIEDGGVQDFYKYRQSIGAGNLQAYALTQRARFKVGE